MTRFINRLLIKLIARLNINYYIDKFHTNIFFKVEKEMFSGDSARIFLHKNIIIDQYIEKARQLYESEVNRVVTDDQILDFKQSTIDRKIKLKSGYRLLLKRFGSDLANLKTLEFGFYNAPLLIYFKQEKIKYEKLYTGVDIVKHYVSAANLSFQDATILHGDISERKGISEIDGKTFDLVITQGVACMTVNPFQCLENAIEYTHKYFMLGHNLIANDELFSGNENYVNCLALGPTSSQNYIFSIIRESAFQEWIKRNKLLVIKELVNKNKQAVYKFGAYRITHYLLEKT